MAELHSNLKGDALHDPKVATNAGNPTGSVTPDFQGQLMWDSTNNKLYFANGATSSDWVQVSGTARPHNLTSMPSWGQYRFAASEDRTLYLYPNFGHIYFNWGNNGTSGFGDEDDGSGDHTSYYRHVNFLDNAAAFGTFSGTMVAMLPYNFRWWDTSGNGLRIQNKFVGNAASSAGNFTFRVEVYDPSTGAAFATPIKTDRTVAATTIEASYSWTSISAATLNSLFLNHDQLIVVMSWGFASAGTGHTHNLYIGALEADWGG